MYSYLTSSQSFHYLKGIHDTTTSDTLSNSQDSSRIVGCVISPQGDLCRYVVRSYWALATNEVGYGDVLLQTQRWRLLCQNDHGRNSGEQARMMQSMPS